MRWHEIKEAWHATHRIRGFKPEPEEVDFFRDPTPREFAKLFNESEHNSLRACMENGHLIVWDANLATHGDAHNLNYSAQTYVGYPILEPAQIIMNDINYDDNNDGEDHEQYPYRASLRRAISNLLSLKAIRDFYGENPRIVGYDNETGAQHIITPEWIEKNVSPGGNTPPR